MAQAIESYLPGVRDNGGLVTNEPAQINNTLTGNQQNVINLNSTNGTSATLTTAQSGSMVVVVSSTGSSIRLPASTPGVSFEICYPSTSAGTHTIVTGATASTFIEGSAYISQVSATTGATFIGNGTSHTGLSMNNTTSGGSAGTYIFATCISATEWVVDASLVGAGQLATPFAAL